MIVSKKIKKLIDQQEGWTRKMFEEGLAMKKRYGVENVYDFSLGNPDVEPPPALVKHMVDILLDPTPGMHRYMPNNGYEDVRAEIAAYLSKKHGLSFAPALPLLGPAREPPSPGNRRPKPVQTEPLRLKVMRFASSRCPPFEK